MKNIVNQCAIIFFIIATVICCKAYPAVKGRDNTPDFTLKNLEGKNVTLSEFKGQKVLLNFFATWCPSCKRELADLNTLTEDEKYGHKILCISLDNSISTVKSYARKHNLKLEILFDNKNVGNDYKIFGIPVTFFLDKEHNITSHHIGALSKKELIQHLKKEK